MGVSRIHRLLRLIILLQGTAPMSAEALSVELGISRRSLFRDLKLLEAAGVPYYHDRGHGYRIHSTFFLPPINLSVTETLGLMLFAKFVEADRANPLAEPALSAVAKLFANVPEPIREACSDMIQHVSIADGRATVATSEKQFYPLLQQAIDERLVCEMGYQSPIEGQPLRGQLRPFALHLSNNAWYVLGKTSIHGNEVRMFKLVRFTELKLTDRPFRRPAKFRVSDKIGNAWQLNPEGKEYDIVLEFEPRVATNVGEVRWHTTQKTTPLPDGRCRLTFRIDGLHEIAWWICGYANQVRVVKPKALRDLVIKMHRDAANALTH